MPIWKINSCNVPVFRLTWLSCFWRPSGPPPCPTTVLLRRYRCKYFSVLFCLYFIFFINCLSYVTYLLFTFLVSTFLLAFFVKTKVIVEKITLSLLHSQTFMLIAAYTIVLAVSPTFLTKLSGFEKCCLCRRLQLDKDCTSGRKQKLLLYKLSAELNWP